MTLKATGKSQKWVVCDGETAGVRAAADDQWMASEWVT